MVSIHSPSGYEPDALPLRHDATRFLKRFATLILSEGLEPPAFGLKARHSNQLSYDSAREFLRDSQLYLIEYQGMKQ